MSFFNKLQKAFGFSYEDEPVETSDSSPLAAAAISAHAVAGTGAHESSATEPQSPAPAPVGDDGVDVTLVFKGVIEVLNRELPPFLKNNLYEDGQRKFIYDSLEQGVKEYLEALAEAQRQKGLKLREQEREKGRRNLDELKDKLKTAEEHFAQEKEKALSAERQKRALGARINDLEGRIATLEAEKEQFEMENRSLLNKLRVAEVTAQMADPEHLQGVLNQLEEKKNEAETLAKENEEMSDAIERLIKEVEEREKKLTEAERQLADSIKAVAEKGHEADEAKNRATEAEHKLADSSQRLQNLETQKNHAQEKLEEAQKGLLEWKTKYEESLLQQSEAAATPEKPAASQQPPLYDFISFDGHDAQSEAPKKETEAPAEKPDAISNVSTPEPKKPEKAPAPKKGPKTEKNANSPVDDLLDDTDWLVEASREMENPDLVVPYNKTPAKPSGNNDHPSQMSLW